MSAAELATSIPVDLLSHSEPARAIEDAAIAAHSPDVVARLHELDREHDRRLTEIRARLQQHEEAFEREDVGAPVENRRTSYLPDALGITIALAALATILASLQFADRWDAVSATLTTAIMITAGTVLHLLGTVRSYLGSTVTNHRGSSYVGATAVIALIATGVIVQRGRLPGETAGLDAVLPSAIATGVCGVALLIAWVDMRRRGAPERARDARYDAARAAWQEELGGEAAALAERHREAALAAVHELDPDARAAIERDLIEAARILRDRDDVPQLWVSMLADSPLSTLRFDDRV